MSIESSFPIVGERFRLELTEPVERTEDGRPVVTVRLSVFDEAGRIRDVKEQQIYFLPERHHNERGREFLDRMAKRIAALDLDWIEHVMPHDLWPSWALLDTPLTMDAVMRALDDPRSMRMLEQAHDVMSIDPDRVAPPSLTNPELEARILAGDDAYAVYGDWLSERGDPRGELIAVQLALETDKALLAREQQLLDDHAFTWLRGLAWARPAEMTVTWRRGFIEAVRFGQQDIVDAPSDTDTEHELRELARLPNIAFLRRIELLRKAYDDDDAGPEVLNVLGLPIEELSIAKDCEIAILDYPGLRTLRTLRIEAHSVELGELDLPELRSLELFTRGLTKDNLAAITPARVPKLESLTLWVCIRGLDGCDVDSAAIAALLSRPFEQLRTLGLCDREVAELLPLVIASPLLPQLRRLDLVGTTLGPEDIAAIREHAAQLAHLEELRLGSHAAELDQLGLPIVADDRFIPVYE